MPQHEAGTLIFTDMECARVRLICTLHYELEIDSDALPVVLSLVDQLYDTRQRLLSLTAAVAAQDKDIQAAIITVMEPNAGSSDPICHKRCPVKQKAAQPTFSVEIPYHRGSIGVGKGPGYPDEVGGNQYNRRLRRVVEEGAVFQSRRSQECLCATRERHRTERIGWLRAAVLGANDGILSTASLVLGVAAAHGTRSNVLVAGVAGLVAGAMSMAAGEYVSVHSQADTEQADLERERAELRADDKGEHKELTAIYVGRGLDPSLAKQVADQLMAHDALGAHARDELGISETLSARPIQAAFASAGSFAVGAAMPLLVTALVPEASLIIFVSGTSLLFLALLGALAARVGGAGVTVGRNTRHVLGCAGDGGNRRRRGLVRNSSVSGAT